MDWSIMLPVIVATAASTAFTLLYGFRSRWRTNPIGRMQFIKSFSLTAVLLLIFINIMFPEYPLREFIRHTVYWLLAVSLCMQVHSLWLVQQGKIQGPNYGRRHDDVVKLPTDPHGWPMQMRK